MAVVMDYPTQLEFGVPRMILDATAWTSPQPSSTSTSASLQLTLLSTSSLAIIAFTSFKFVRRSTHSLRGLSSRRHVVCNGLGIPAATACTILTALAASNNAQSETLLTVTSMALWSIIVTIRLLYFLFPSHRPLLHLFANLLSLSIFISTLIPKYIFPYVLFNYRPPYSDPVSFVHLGFAVASAIVLPILSPYHIQVSDGAVPPHPRTFSSPVTRWWTYSWITAFITKSYSLKANLSIEDLPPLTPHSIPTTWVSRFDSIRSGCSSTSSTLARMFYPRLATMALLMIICGLSEFLGAFGLRNLLLHLEDRSSTIFLTPWSAVFLFGASPVIRGLFMQTFEFFSTDSICHLKGMIISIIYQRILSPRVGFPPDAGQVTNLVSADIDKLATLRYTIMAVFMVPVEVLVSSVLLYRTMGWSCVPGLGILLVTRVPIAWYFSKLQGVVQSNVMTSIDARVRRVSETVKGLQTVKMLGQGSSFVTWITEKRKAELQALWRKWIIVAFSDAVSSLFVLVPLVLSLGMYTLVAKMPLEPSVVFTILSVFNTLQKTLGLTVIGASCYAQSMVSLGRLCSYLDENPNVVLRELRCTPLVDVSDSDRVFGCKDMTISVKSHENKNITIIRNASFDLVRGGLNVVVGKTGSGKSSLLKALMAEFPLSSGHACLRSHPAEPISYASQTPWLRRGTIRDNIIFSSAFSLKRYNEILHATALDIDLKTLASGDLTDVGEAGSSLSGGQRSRVALARAIYASNQTVVLDDVLSALDAHTSSFVLENAILGPLMKCRTVILVSQDEKCKAVADQIIELDNGEAKLVTNNIQSRGLAEGSNEEPAIMIYQHEIPSCSTSTTIEVQATGGSVNPPSDLEARRKEDLETTTSDPKSEAILTGLIGRLAMFKYLRLFGSAPMLMLLCLVLLIAQGLDVASSLCLTIWSSSHSSTSNPTPLYISIYSCIGISWISMATSGTLLLFSGAILAGQTLHSKMLVSVLGSTLAFITTTSPGQLINRFSSDMFSLDNTLPELVKQVVENYLSIIFRVAALSSVLPVFLLPATIFLGMGIITGQVYMHGSTASKRLYAAGLSPILSSIVEGVSGIEVIRAFGVQRNLETKFMASLEIYLRGWETVSASQRWLAVRMDFLAGMISFSTAALSMMLAKDNPAKVGFSMTSSSTLCTALLYAVYLSSIVEVEMNSFQRVEQYIDGIPQEEIPSTGEESTPRSWPWQGDLRVSNLTAGYSLDGEPVLEDISLSVEPGKRIAIVGRSGSGKSSLVASILRLAVKQRGNVTIDGVDVSDVNVQRLRQAVSFIPQDPILFEGTLRFNLDFTGTISDAVLQDTLAQVVGGGEELQKAWSLDQPISLHGSNLSQGERQLIAMTRALANNARIVIIDEATANLDPESDHRIQQLLRKRFSHKAVIAIAHRLNTILDFDEVLVMDMGRLIERGIPKLLIESGKGRFWEMWVASEDNSRGSDGKDKGGPMSHH